MATFSFLMMLFALIVQGLYFWARDAVTPHLPTQFFLSDVVWAVTLCSLVAYRRYPWVTIACSWSLFFTVTIVLWKFYFSHTIPSMLLLTSAATTNHLFAHFREYGRQCGSKQ